MIGLGIFANSYSEEQVKQHIAENYCVDISLVNKYEILCAYEDYGDYCGESFFLLRDKETGKLFENHASHCSCAGFEEQFDPKESSLIYLRSDNFYADGVSKEIMREIVKDL